ncbi:hypothetical protein BYT27DRAFT_7193700, partial [Phlegmacium glaucopus]
LTRYSEPIPLNVRAYGFGWRRIRKFRVSGSKQGTMENCQTLVLWNSKADLAEMTTRTCGH